MPSREFGSTLVYVALSVVVESLLANVLLVPLLLLINMGVVARGRWDRVSELSVRLESCAPFCIRGPRAAMVSNTSLPLREVINEAA
jgi:hypothetical protein